MDIKTKVDPYAKLKEFLDESSQERITQRLNEHLTTPVNIGIVGSRGSGKSTLIRALTDLFPPDPRAPATGSIHRTRYPAPYLHPQSENIVFWDCPGLGSIEQSKSTNASDFSQENYFEKISKLDNNMENETIKNRLPNFVIPERVTYDCFLICGDRGFNKDDADLAKIFSEQNINFYFVKTKFDDDLMNVETNNAAKLTDEQVEEEKNMIRQNVLEILDKRFGLKNFKDRIFIISAMVNPVRNIDNRLFYDFPLLQKAIMENMPDEKKNTLILALLPLVKEDVSTKCNLLRKRINLSSVLLAVIGFFFLIPETSFIFELALITKELFTYAKALNLSKEMIEKMAISYGISYDSIEQNVLNNHAFVKAVMELNVKTVLNGKFLSLAKEQIYFVLAPFLVYFLFMAPILVLVLVFAPVLVLSRFEVPSELTIFLISFTTIQVPLRKIINELETTAVELIEYCSKNSNFTS